MSAETWDRELASLTGKLGQEGAISAAQAEMLERLAAEVSALTRERRGQRAALVRTAVPLTEKERAQIEALIARRFGAGRRVTFEVDPQVLGGAWLRVGDRIIDGSLRGRLEALRHQMKSPGGRD